MGDSSNISVSVLMPSYNAERYIDEAITSALSEMQLQDELIVHDGGSTDSTSHIVSEWARRDERVKLFVEKDAGQSDALNRALHKAGGQFIMWMNADDLLTRGGLKALRAKLTSDDNATKLVTGGHSTARADGSTIATYRPGRLTHERLMQRGCYIFSGSLLIERSSLIRLGGFSEDFDFCMDLDLFFRFASLDAYAIATVDDLVGVLRWHDASKSGGQGQKFVVEGIRVRRKYRRTPIDGARLIRAASVQSLALATVSLRHSAFYSALRGRARK